MYKKDQFKEKYHVYDFKYQISDIRSKDNTTMFFIVYQDIGFRWIDQLYYRKDIGGLPTYFKVVDEGILPFITGAFRFTIYNKDITSLDSTKLIDVVPIQRNISIMTNSWRVLGETEQYNAITSLEMQNLYKELNKEINNEIEYLKSFFDKKKLVIEFK